MIPIKFVAMVVAYAGLTMVIAYPWHMIWFHDVYMELKAYTRSEPIVMFGLLAMLTQGVVMAYFYPLFYKGGNPALQGIKFGLVMGLMVYSVMGFAMVAKIDINPISTYLLYNAVFQTIQFVITGAAIGLIYGKDK